MIPLKSEKELDMMRKAGRVLVRVLEDLSSFIKPGVTTFEIDQRAALLIKSYGAIPAFKGYKGFPGNVCTSVNEVVVHGIPSERLLLNGDIISLDMGVRLNNYFADAAATFAVGKISHDAKALIKVTESALYAGIQQVWPGNWLSNVSCAMQDLVESSGFSVVRSFVGHGIGLSLHEPPEIPNFGTPGKGILLKTGMVLALEPMVNIGTHEVEVLGDGWTAVTKDRSLSGHFEHTVAVTEDGSEILTRWRRKKLS